MAHWIKYYISINIVTDLINALSGNSFVNTVQYATIDETVFYMSSAPRPVLLTDPSTISLVEAGSNTSTVTLRVVGGDEKGSLKSETIKYDGESQGTRTRERLRWQGPAAYTKDRSVLSSERASNKKQDCNCQRVINIWLWAPDEARHQDILTGRQSQCDFVFDFELTSREFRSPKGTTVWPEEELENLVCNFSQITNYTVLCATVYCKSITSSLLK
jgi:hypothetical protein